MLLQQLRNITNDLQCVTVVVVRQTMMRPKRQLSAQQPLKSKSRPTPTDDRPNHCATTRPVDTDRGRDVALS